MDENTIDTIIDSFMNECRHRRLLDPKTIRAYQADVDQFRRYMKDRPFSRDSMLGFIEYLNRMYKVSTVKRKLACTRSMMAYAEYEGLIERSPFAGIKVRIREPQNLPRSLSKDEMNRLYRYAYGQLTDDPARSLLNVAILEILFSTGMRVAELCAMDISDMDAVSGRLIIHGKGSRERVSQICNEDSLRTIRRYLNNVPRMESGKGPMLVNPRGNRVNEQYVRRTIHSMARNCLDRDVTPHMIRHTFATLLLEEGVDIRYIQKALGHSSILTTQRYLSVTDSKQRDIMTNYHPRNSIRIDL